MTAHRDLKQRTLRSLGWQLLGAGGQRVVQFLGIAVVARLLPEADIGLFAIVLVSIASVEALTAFTGEQSQIHSSRGGEKHYLDTVFTVRVLRSIVVSSLLAALAPVFAWFFHRPEVQERYWLTGLFLTLTINGFLDALQSPARAARIKELDFRRVATGDLAASILGTSCACLLAWLQRDVWAMVIGTLVSTALRSAASYVVAPYRPRLRLDREALRELRSYALGGAGTPFLLMVIAQGPALVLGKLYESAVLGIYSNCERLSKIGEDICLRVLAPVAIPAYSKLKDDPKRLTDAWLKSMRTISLVVFPGIVGLVWMGNALPAVVFKPEYGGIPWLFPVLALRGGIASVNSLIGPLFWGIGEPWRDRRAQAARLGVLATVAVPLAVKFGATGYAAGACCAISTAFAVSMTQVLRRLPVAGSDVLRCFVGAVPYSAALVVALGCAELAFAPIGLTRVLLGVSLTAIGVAAAAMRAGVLDLRVARRST